MSRARPYRLTTLLLACVASSAIAGSSMQYDDSFVLASVDPASVDLASADRASLGMSSKGLNTDRASIDPFDIPAISGGFSRAEPVSTGSVQLASTQPAGLSNEPGAPVAL